MHLTATTLTAAALAAAIAALPGRAFPQRPRSPAACPRSARKGFGSCLVSLSLAAAPADRTPVLLAQASPVRPAAPASRAVRTQASGERAAADAAASGTLRPCSAVTVDPPTYLTLGKSQVVRLPFPVSRLIVGGSGRAGRPAGARPRWRPRAVAAPAVAQAAPPGPRGGPAGVADTDVTLLSPTELFFLGRQPGSMNVVLQANDGRCLVKDLVVTVDAGTLQATLKELLPGQPGVRVRGAEDSLVLSGEVPDVLTLQQVMTVAGAYADTKKVVNLMRVAAPQQVMLEVQIAEVSKSLLDRLGAAANITRTTAWRMRNTFSLVSDFLTGAGGVVQALRKGHTALHPGSRR